MKQHFGTFVTEITIAAIAATPSRSPITNNHVPELPPLNINGAALSKPASITNGSPISLPTSMQSSFEGEMANNLQNFNQVSHSI